MRESGIAAVKQPEAASSLVSLGHTSTLCKALIAPWTPGESERAEQDSLPWQQIRDQAFELTGLCAANHRKPVSQCPLLLDFIDRIEEQRGSATAALQNDHLSPGPNTIDPLASAILLVGSVLLLAAVCPAWAQRASALPVMDMLRNVDDPQVIPLVDFLDRMLPDQPAG